MEGHVDDHGRALVEVQLATDPDQDATPLQVWIDTGFTGQLLIPRDTIDRMRLTQTSGTHARLADGSTAFLETFEATLIWFGERVTTEVIEGHGEFPLLGVIPLLGCRLVIDFATMTILIEKK